jgi:integrase
MEDLIEAHLDWCRAADYSPNTIEAKRLLLTTAHKQLPTGLEATDREITRWLGQPDRKPEKRWSANTKACAYSHLTSFYNWAIEAGELDWSPMKRLRRPRVPGGAPDPWTNDQLAELLRRAVQPWHLAVILASYSGLRCCEIVQVSPRSVADDMIRVKGKGGKVAVVDLHPVVAEELSHFGAGPMSKVPYIVQAGGRADARWLSKRSREYFHRRLHIPVHLHQGRHWYVTGVYEAQGEAAAQQAARHSSITSTMSYTKLRNGQRRSGILALPVLNPVVS